jgi:hypothetical protein
MSHWDGPAVAEKLDASVHAVWRVLRREGIYLQRRRSWCVSTDKEFAPKAADVVGLYLNPPVNALVLSVDEKPSIQATERPSGYVETDSGKVVRGLKSTYKRHCRRRRKGYQLAVEREPGVGLRSGLRWAQK